MINPPTDKGESPIGSHPPVPAPPPQYTPSAEASMANLSIEDSSANGSSEGPSTTLPSELVSAPHTSHLSLIVTNSAIKLAHNVDLRNPLSPGALEQQPTEHEDQLGPDGERVNVYLASTNGAVKGVFAVWGKDEKDSRVRVVLNSRNGSVRCDYHSRVPLELPISTRATSTNGSVTVYLPPSYRGPVLSYTKNGSLKLSDRAKTVYTPLGSYESDGTPWQLGFVGDANGWDGKVEEKRRKEVGKEVEGQNRWDESWLKSQNGSLYVRLGEEVGVKSDGESTFGKVLKSLWGK